MHVLSSAAASLTDSIKIKLMRAVSDIPRRNLIQFHLVSQEECITYYSSISLAELTAANRRLFSRKLNWINCSSFPLSHFTSVGNAF